MGIRLLFRDVIFRSSLPMSRSRDLQLSALCKGSFPSSNKKEMQGSPRPSYRSLHLSLRKLVTSEAAASSLDTLRTSGCKISRGPRRKGPSSARCVLVTLRLSVSLPGRGIEAIDVCFRHGQLLVDFLLYCLLHPLMRLRGSTGALNRCAAPSPGCVICSMPWL